MHRERLMVQQNSIESRVSSLETSVESLTKSLHSFTDEMRRDIASLHSGIALAGRPQWSTYIGFAGVILTIVGMVGGAVFVGYSANAHRIEQSLSAMISRALELEYKRGVSETEIASLNRLTQKLDVDLQREMRDVNATTEAKLEALDAKVQGEIKDSANRILESRQSLEKIVERVSGFQDSAKQLHGTQNEQLRALERAVYGADNPTEKSSPKP